MRIIKYSICLFIMLQSSSFIKGQKVFSYIINDFAEVNPAGISTIGNFQLNLKGFNNPEMDEFFNGGYLKLVAPIDKLNSTVGFHTQFYSFNDLSDIKYGLSYSYKFKFTENSFLAVGTKASVFFMKDKYQLYYINNYPYIENEFKSTKLNLDAGVWLQNNNLGIGLSYNHINAPDHHYEIKQNPIYPNQFTYKPEFNLMLNHELKIVQNFKMSNSMIIYDIENMTNLTEININNIFNLNNTFLFGSAWEILRNTNTRIQFYNIIGFNLSNKYQIYVSYLMQDYESEKYFFNTSKKVKPDFECSFIINI